MAQEQTKTRKRWWLWAAAAAVLVLAGFGAYFLLFAPETEPQYDTGVWYAFTPSGTCASDGETVTAYVRLGSADKTIVMFCGGGMSVDEYTAARSYTELGQAEGFYSDDGSSDARALLTYGIFSTAGMNPFSDWNMIVIPYSTGDFHVGAGEFTYTTLDGETAVLYHHGYANYQAIMSAALRYVPDTQELLICGYSAGGYAAAMLADDLVENYYPDAQKLTLCVDSAVFEMNDWETLFEDVWNVQESIRENITSGDLVVDSCAALYEKYGDRMTFLYTGSVRDGELIRYQSYLDTGVFEADMLDSEGFTKRMAEMIERLREAVPTLGCYIFEDLPYYVASMEISWQRPEEPGLTQHCVLPRAAANWTLVDGVTALDWLSQAVDGQVESYGLELLAE